MKKIAFCLVLLGLSTITFVGCGDDAKTKPARSPPLVRPTRRLTAAPLTRRTRRPRLPPLPAPPPRLTKPSSCG